MQAQLRKLFEKSVEIRVFETQVAKAADAGQVPGLVHLCNGAEVLQGAICSKLDGKTDSVTGSHRSHGLALAMGADPYKVAAEIFGNADGLSGGMGGTQHLLAPECGFLSSNGIVGGQVPMASGAALTAKTLKTGGIAVCFFGDGAANQGAVLETMNLAVALKLPLLFVLENNGFGQSTSADFACGGVSLSDRAKAFGLNTYEIDGYVPEDCLQKSEEIIEGIRKGGRPAFIEAKVPRLAGHYHGENAAYLSSCGDAKDPLKALDALVGAVSDIIWKNAEVKMQAVFEQALTASPADVLALQNFHHEMGGYS